MASIIVGLTATAGGGKSEAALHLTENHNFRLVKFAGPLKAMLRAFYVELGIDPDTIDRKLEGDLKEVECEYLCGRTPRHAMETLGTEWGREQMHPELWTNAYYHTVSTEDGPVVTDDVRFDNEADLLYRQGGMVLKLEPKIKRRKKSDHAAERGVSVDKVLATISNNSTIQALRDKLDVFLGAFTWK